MNVPTINVPADLARQKYEQFAHAIRRRPHTADDENIMLGYKALAAGKQILDLNAVFAKCPPNQQGLPCFAVARPTWRECCLHWNFGFEFSNGRSKDYRHRFHFRTRILPSHFQSEPSVFRSRGSFRAMIPAIPLPIRPYNLKPYTILWEAEWTPVAPVDPLLLRKLGRGRSPLYVILAAWDLTELERSVLAGRFNEDQR